MTEGRKNWETLLSQARDESVPTLDVSSQVAQRIAGSCALPVSHWPTWPAAVLSVAAALMMMLTASLTGLSWNDPLGDWFSSMFLVMS